MFGLKIISDEENRMLLSKNKRLEEENTSFIRKQLKLESDIADLRSQNYKLRRWLRESFDEHFDFDVVNINTKCDMCSNEHKSCKKLSIGNDETVCIIPKLKP